VLLTDRIAIVTGAAQGIGRAIAERYLDHGATVVVADLDGAPPPAPPPAPGGGAPPPPAPPPEGT
jgi:NAD(P)-dependent dehydrogenase (short-subunit alcohol dehydrogenase family)